VPLPCIKQTLLFIVIDDFIIHLPHADSNRISRTPAIISDAIYIFKPSSISLTWQKPSLYISDKQSHNYRDDPNKHHDNDDGLFSALCCGKQLVQNCLPSAHVFKARLDKSFAFLDVQQFFMIY
jgi:hypothetical protein